MTEEELIAEFGKDGWYQMKDEIYNRYRFTPMKSHSIARSRSSSEWD